jgi:hypothetical protein
VSCGGPCSVHPVKQALHKIRQEGRKEGRKEEIPFAIISPQSDKSASHENHVAGQIHGIVLQAVNRRH